MTGTAPGKPDGVRRCARIVLATLTCAIAAWVAWDIGSANGPRRPEPPCQVAEWPPPAPIERTVEDGPPASALTGFPGVPAARLVRRGVGEPTALS